MRIASMTFTLLLALTLCFGQDSSVQVPRFNFGISPHLNLPLKVGHSEPISNQGEWVTNVGFGVQLYGNVPLKSAPAVSVSSSLGFNRYSFNYNNFIYRTDNINLQLGVNLRPFGDNNQIKLAYQPSFLTMASATFIGRQNANGTNYTNIIDIIDHRAAQGVYIGFDFDLNDKSSLELGYTQLIKTTKTPPDQDPRFSAISISINTDLGKRWKYDEGRNAHLKTLLPLQNDTLYFINRSCEGELSNAQLDSILHAHYTFSAFKVLDDNEIVSTRATRDVIHFAVIGKYYASESSPTTTGIFLLDHEMNLTETPYPFYTYVWNRGGEPMNLCFNNLKNVVAVVERFNERMALSVGQ